MVDFSFKVHTTYTLIGNAWILIISQGSLRNVIGHVLLLHRNAILADFEITRNIVFG